MKVLEVNDNDIYGKVFNGYDISEKLNKKEEFDVKQIVLHKFSDNNNVIKFFDSPNVLLYEHKLHELEKDVLSVQSMLSFNNKFLFSNEEYINSDLVHYHQIHNSHLNLVDLFNEIKYKPSIISLHDPWFMTGRCVHPMKCNKWKNGCKGCKHMDTLFSFEEDNCNSMWNIKSMIKDTDVDIIVSSKFMMDMVKNSPYMKDLRVHLLPFGIDLYKYKKSKNKDLVKRELGIDKDSLVLFFREQEALKGTNYIVDALNDLKVHNNITLLTCSETGLLDTLKDRYNIIELGNINEELMIKCYQASDIFLMPSLGESFGMMAIEAMAASLPVVVFDNTALPSVTAAPDIGVLVKNLDSNDLRKKIEFLINNEDERIIRGKLGRKYAEENYNIDKYYGRLEKIYKDVYKKQRYKLKLNRCFTEKNVDYFNNNSQLLLKKLKIIYNKLDLSKKQLKIFKKIDKTSEEIGKIDYCLNDSINIISEFNNEIYDILNSVNKKDFKIYNSRLYKKLKSISIIHKPVVFVKKIIQKLT